MQQGKFKYSDTIVNTATWTTVLWTVAMLVGAWLVRPTAATLSSPEHQKLLSGDFSSSVFLGALGWLGIIVDKGHGSALDIFTGISMLLGPVWGYMVFKDFNKAVGSFAIVACGIAASIVITGTPWGVGNIIGGIVAPVIFAMFVFGLAVQQVKETVQETMGVETDTQKRHRLDREFQRENDREYRRRSG